MVSRFLPFLSSWPVTLEDLVLYPTILLSYFLEETEMCELYTQINEQKLELAKINENCRQVSAPFYAVLFLFFNERICLY